MPASVSSLTRRLDAVPAVVRDRVEEPPMVVWQILETVPDPRRAQGRRHPLPSVVTLALAAVVAGARSLAASETPETGLRRSRGGRGPRWGITRRPPGSRRSGGSCSPSTRTCSMRCCTPGWPPPRAGP
jgi:hypothetical protein